ncbi:hypothetical protein H4Q26_005618 [Puccinia striiformis f. sp. tritici PST-130]|nr:hypothetical protein H4Q26_005618 [Puccinia striiformis f. sp. tritici PST-130]
MDANYIYFKSFHQETGSSYNGSGQNQHSHMDRLTHNGMGGKNSLAQSHQVRPNSNPLPNVMRPSTFLSSPIVSQSNYIQSSSAVQSEMNSSFHFQSTIVPNPPSDLDTNTGRKPKKRRANKMKNYWARQETTTGSSFVDSSVNLESTKDDDDHL